MYIINVKFLKMTYHEILSERCFGKFYADTLIVHVTYTLVSQKRIVPQDIVLIQTMWISDKSQYIILVIHSDTENENETHGAGKRFFASTEE